jgi:hypothetical protein
MPTKVTKLGKNKYKVEGVGFVSDQELIDDNICPDCLNELPAPVYEDRGEGYSEAVTYCKCGSVFTGGI